MKTLVLIAALGCAMLVPVAAQDAAPAPTIESLSRSVLFLVGRLGEMEKKTRDLERRVKQLESAVPPRGQARDIVGGVRQGQARVVELFGAGLRGPQESAIFVLEAVEPARLPKVLVESLQGNAEPIWLLGWDGQRDINGPELRHSTAARDDGRSINTVPRFPDRVGR